jgi:metallophosphoesterase (TIGR03768 family)
MTTKLNKLNFKISAIILTGILMLAGCTKDDSDITQSKVITTLDRTIIPNVVPAVPTVSIYDVANYEKYGYGTWHYGPGLACQKRLDLMPSGYDYTTVTKAARLLRFFTITDVHLNDKESTAQGYFFAPYVGVKGSGIYSPLMLYTTQVLEATVRTINKLHKQDPFDLGLALGDLATSTQYNELRWFIDIMDGQTIKPYSGGVKDPIPGPANDYEDEFKAEGLAPSIPWYAAIGNHDHYWQGADLVCDKIRQVLTGGTILQIGNVITDPVNAFNENTYSMGTIDGSTPYGTIIGAGVVSTMGTIPLVTPDPNRRSLLKSEWISEFGNSTSLPSGHGFIQSDQANKYGACYSFEPESELPLKIIVLDDTQDESDAANNYCGHGDLCAGRYDWLMSQLKAGQEEGKLMIIAAHVPIGVAAGTEKDWITAPGYTSENDLITQLKSFSNLILWVAGHRHVNNVTAFRSTDPGHPENGFWQVETASLRDFPEQFRTFDLVRNSDNTISIITTNVDADMPDGSLAAIARSYAIATNQIYGVIPVLLPTGSVSYNAELFKQLSSEMQAKISNY